MAKEWYCNADGQVTGPFSPAELRQFAAEGAVRPDDHVGNHLKGPWFPASRVHGLFDGKLTGAVGGARRAVPGVPSETREAPGKASSPSGTSGSPGYSKAPIGVAPVPAATMGAHRSSRGHGRYSRGRKRQRETLLLVVLVVAVCLVGIVAAVVLTMNPFASGTAGKNNSPKSGKPSAESDAAAANAEKQAEPAGGENSDGSSRTRPGGTRPADPNADDPLNMQLVDEEETVRRRSPTRDGAAASNRGDAAGTSARPARDRRPKPDSEPTAPDGEQPPAQPDAQPPDASGNRPAPGGQDETGIEKMRREMPGLFPDEE